MKQVHEHYEKHLASYYGWMLGNMQAKITETENFFKANNLLPEFPSVAIDLGCGNGLQTIPLARLGYKVVAVDFSATLLEELKDNATGLDVELIEANILDFDAYAALPADLIVCMGDTLTHLESEEQVRALFRNAWQSLKTGGTVVISYRDLSFELQDEQRFIPVRATDNRIFTCFLEYFPGYVKVFDIVQERTEGEWKQKVSSYKKLRLGQDDVNSLLTDSGFTISGIDRKNNLVTFIAGK